MAPKTFYSFYEANSNRDFRNAENREDHFSDGRSKIMKNQSISITEILDLVSNCFEVCPFDYLSWALKALTTLPKKPRIIIFTY